MRNTPFPFWLEDTLESIAQRAQGVRNNGIARPIRLARQAMEAHRMEIAEHKWFLSERLGRDVGNQVAALDYAENIAQISARQVEPFKKLLRAALQRTRESVETLAESAGMQALSEAQRVMHGVPGSTEPYKNKATIADREFRAIHIPARKMAQHRSGIQEHKWFLSERLGRDTGSKVAALDYLENVKPRERRKSPAARIAGVLEGMMETSGPNSIANLERALRARGSINQ